MNAGRVLIIVLIVSIFGIPTGLAVPPANHACLGQSVSDLIDQFSGAQFGAGVSTVATNPGQYGFKNLGSGVQELLAGNIPDMLLITNTCNDPP